MSYTTIAFFIFVAVTVLAYYLFPVKKYKWTVLLAASYVFYFFTGFRYAFFILFTTISTWGAALMAERISRVSADCLKTHKKEWSREERKAHKKRTQRKMKLVLAAALVANLGILVFLKYYNFLAGGLNDLLGLAGLEFSAPLMKLFLPLGISFYTFQSMGYMIDVYRGNVEAEKNPLKFALFIAFFPQIIQGPIGSWEQLAHQLFTPHSPEFKRIQYGLELILWGYFKKLVIADRAVTAIQAVTADYTQYNGTAIGFTVLLYALQLYADFSAGIDISRGIAGMMGIDMADNFRRPYFSRSINEYWRRWHITLGAWMKNYLFYPLAMSPLFLNAGKRMKKSRLGQTSFGAHVAKVLPTSIASLIVFLMVGIWHGANGKYIAFGLWNGLIIMMSILLKPVFDKMTGLLRINRESGVYRTFQMVRTFIIVLIGYVFDIAPDFAGAMDMMRRTVTDAGLSVGMNQVLNTCGLLKADYLVLLAGMLIMLFVSVIQEKRSIDSIGGLFEGKPFILQWCAVFCCIMSIIVFGIYGPGYNPADFVYMQF